MAAAIDPEAIHEYCLIEYWATVGRNEKSARAASDDSGYSALMSRLTMSELAARVKCLRSLPPSNELAESHIVRGYARQLRKQMQEVTAGALMKEALDLTLESEATDKPLQPDHCSAVDIESFFAERPEFQRAAVIECGDQSADPGEEEAEADSGNAARPCRVVETREQGVQTSDDLQPQVTLPAPSTLGSAPVYQINNASSASGPMSKFHGKDADTNPYRRNAPNVTSKQVAVEQQDQSWDNFYNQCPFQTAREYAQTSGGAEDNRHHARPGQPQQPLPVDSRIEERPSVPDGPVIRDSLKRKFQIPKRGAGNEVSVGSFPLWYRLAYAS
jgi:hypothetical protein